MAAHLLNRAGFGGPPSQIQKLADLSHEGAISSLLDYDNIYDNTINPDWAHPNPDEIKQLRDALKAAATPEEKRQIQQRPTRCGPDPIFGIARLVVAAHGARAAAVSGKNGFVLAWTFCHQLGEGAEPLLSCGGKMNCSAGSPRVTGNYYSTKRARTRRCWSGWTRRKAARSIRTKISLARSWNCLLSAKAITPNMTSRKGRAR